MGRARFSGILTSRARRQNRNPNRSHPDIDPVECRARRRVLFRTRAYQFKNRTLIVIVLYLSTFASFLEVFFMSYSKTYLNCICSGFLTLCSGNYLLYLYTKLFMSQGRDQTNPLRFGQYIFSISFACIQFSSSFVQRRRT